MYWYSYANKADSILNQERARIRLYEDITGIKSSSIEDFERIYKLSQQEKLEKDLRIEGLEKNLKSVNRRNKVLKVGTFVFIPTALIGGMILGVKLTK